MRNQTIDQLWAEAEAVCEWLKEHRGYDTTDFHWLVVHASAISFELSFEDDFQANASREQSYHSGKYQTIKIDNGDSLWNWAARLPTREKREVSFLIRQLQPIAGAAEQVRNLEIQEIMQGILGANSSLHNLLEGPETENGKHTDEVPF